MVGGVRSAWIHGAGALALVGYGVLGFHADRPEARPWLLLATLLGWLTIAAVAWFARKSPPTRLAVIGWAVAFRLTGLGTEPSWEDDYYRYLWDGYQTVSTGDPYGRAPMDSFGDEGNLPDSVVDALDLINHPELRTVYGPVAQGCFAIAAWFGVGSLLVWKCGLVVLELAGWFWLSKQVSWRVGLLLWWCPLAVTEIAFAGHVDGVGVAALALAVSAWQRGRERGAVVGMAFAAGTKVLGAVLLPFIACRFGMKAALAAFGIILAFYLPFLVQGSWVGLDVLRVMSASFEYNSTGFALLRGIMADAHARGVAAVLVLLFAFGCWWRWWRAGNLAAAPPLAAIFGGLFLWSPVFNPWYALWLLPGWAIRPSAWGIGVLVAVPLTYAHGWGDAGGATASYMHPGWVRPAEGVVFLLVVLTAYLWKRRKAGDKNAATD
ncbi:MAG: DUF2029 domain-containing protein [Synoicihabitans sp.]